jgi:hypothetical protein
VSVPAVHSIESGDVEPLIPENLFQGLARLQKPAVSYLFLLMRGSPLQKEMMPS